MFTLFGINGPFNKSLVSCLIKNVLVNCVNVKVEANCGVNVGLGLLRLDNYSFISCRVRHGSGWGT